MTQQTHPNDTSIIIVEASSAGETIIIGALVDAVKGVRVFEQSQLEPPPKVGMKLSLELIHAIGKTDKDFTLILNVDKVLSDDDISLARELFDAEGGAEAK